MFLIAGLGNPGLKYSHTRHNAGFDALDVLADQYHISIKKKECRALTGAGLIEGVKVLLVKPQTFMNLSGEALQALLAYYNVNPETELLVISDDVALEIGKMRIRKKGSAGGHNGLKNIIAMLHTENFLRLRIGVGQPEPGDDMIGHVLRKPVSEDRKKLKEVYESAADAVALIVQGSTDKAMNLYN